MGLQPPAPMGSCSPSTISPSLALFFSNHHHRAARTSPLSSQRSPSHHLSSSPFSLHSPGRPPFQLPQPHNLFPTFPSLSLFSDQTTSSPSSLLLCNSRPNISPPFSLPLSTTSASLFSGQKHQSSAPSSSPSSATTSPLSSRPWQPRSA